MFFWKKKKEKSREEILKASKSPSIAFLMGIPAAMLIGSVCLFSVISLFGSGLSDSTVLSAFAIGFIGGLGIIGGSDLPRFRTFAHELKHAAVVVLTGNVLKNVKIGKNTGEVEYQLYENQLHFAPLIILAPYFFPLFSFPMLILCLLFGENDRVVFALLLGAALSIDLTTAYKEFDHRQVDFSQIVGRLFTASLYIATTNFMWICICLVWLQGGRTAFVYTAYVFAKVAHEVAKLMPGWIAKIKFDIGQS